MRVWGTGVFLPNGIAVTPSGLVDVDTNGVNGYTDVAGIVQLGAGGHVSVLWKS
jgi:hypothetical protein